MSKIIKTDEEWKSLLTEDEYYVTRQKGTEPPFSGKNFEIIKGGIFKCKCCGNELFNTLKVLGDVETVAYKISKITNSDNISTIKMIFNQKTANVINDPIDFNNWQMEKIKSISVEDNITIKNNLIIGGKLELSGNYISIDSIKILEKNSNNQIEIKDIEKEILKRFKDTIDAINNQDEKIASDIVKSYKPFVAKMSDDIVHNVISNTTKISSESDAATIVLYARYLKRIGAHLKNITTAVINPYDKVGYQNDLNLL